MASNRYFGFRHGESEANVQHLIASDITTQSPFGLTPNGRKQVEDTLHQASFLIEPIVYASDFTRTRQTAEMIASYFSVPIHWCPALRERYFGSLDQGSDSRYSDVWALDRQDASHTTFGVESLITAQKRLHDLIVLLDSTYSQRNIVLVTHGDIIALLRAMLSHTDLRRFRDFAVKTGSLTLL